MLTSQHLQNGIYSIQESKAFSSLGRHLFSHLDGRESSPGFHRARLRMSLGLPLNDKHVGSVSSLLAEKVLQSELNI